MQQLPFTASGPVSIKSDITVKSDVVLVPDSKFSRFGERQKFLPIAFLLATMALLYTVYVGLHCVPLLQIGAQAHLVDRDMRSRGIFQLIVFHVLTIMLNICYVRSILEHPGEIPDNDPMWAYTGESRKNDDQSCFVNLQEMKKSGDRRHCKWCGKYKPDRCHHCRVCRTCILKMDHHCPWIYNCVGFHNYKYFLLLLFYSVLDLQFMAWTLPETVARAMDLETPFATMFLVLFGETMSSFLGTLITAFFAFHVWLMLKAMTTIEFCEKKMPRSASSAVPDIGSVYDLGKYSNLRTVLGANPLLWIVPIETSIGDGLNYLTSEQPLLKDMEGGTKGIRKKTHQKIQRSPLRQDAIDREDANRRPQAYGATSSSRQN